MKLITLPTNIKFHILDKVDDDSIIQMITTCSEFYKIYRASRFWIWRLKQHKIKFDCELPLKQLQSFWYLNRRPEKLTSLGRLNRALKRLNHGFGHYKIKSCYQGTYREVGHLHAYKGEPTALALGCGVRVGFYLDGDDNPSIQSICLSDGINTTGG